MALLYWAANIRWGQCFPSGCSSTDALINYKLLYEDVDAYAGELATPTTRQSQEELNRMDAAAIGVT